MVQSANCIWQSTEAHHLHLYRFKLHSYYNAFSFLYTLQFFLVYELLKRE